MDATYSFFCGLVWAQSGEDFAGIELIRARASCDLKLRMLALAMLRCAGSSKRRP